MGRDIFHYPRLFTAPSKLALDTSRDTLEAHHISVETRHRSGRVLSLDVFLVMEKQAFERLE